MPKTKATVKLSKGQSKWLIGIMAGTYQYEDDADYQALWSQLKSGEGKEITGTQALNGLYHICDSVIDRATYGDHDKDSRRDKGFGRRIMVKIQELIDSGQARKERRGWSWSIIAN